MNNLKLYCMNDVEKVLKFVALLSKLADERLSLEKSKYSGRSIF